MDGLSTPRLADAAREAADLMGAVSGRQSAAISQPASQNHPNATGKHDGGGNFGTFWWALNEEQRSFLAVIAKNTDSVVGDELAREIDIDVNSIGWIRRKIDSAAAVCNINIDGLYEVVSVDVDGKLKRAYQATNLLRNEVASVPNI